MKNLSQKHLQTQFFSQVLSILTETKEPVIDVFNLLNRFTLDSIGQVKKLLADENSVMWIWFDFFLGGGLDDCFLNRDSFYVSVCNMSLYIYISVHIIISYGTCTI